MTDADAGPAVTRISRVDTVVVRGVVPTDELRSFFDRSFSTLGAALAEAGVTPSGPAFAFYVRPPQATTELEVGFPVDGPVEPSGEVVASRLPGGPVATLVHEGGYDGLGESWSRLQQWVAQQGLRQASGFWEDYLTEPIPDGDPADNRTALHLPLED